MSSTLAVKTTQMYDVHGAFDGIFTSRGGAGILNTLSPPASQNKKKI